MQVRTSLQTDNHASIPPLSFFTGRMPFLPPNQQRQSTEGIQHYTNTFVIIIIDALSDSHLSVSPVLSAAVSSGQSAGTDVITG